MTPDLIARYEGKRLPRYTSYPTAPHFTPEVDETVFARWLGDLPPDAALSVYLHIPFCAELCLYCGCHTAVARRYEPVAAYVELIEREIDLVAGRLGERRPLSHLHWGGGTPTILSGADLERLTARLRKRFRFAPDAEIAVEIDPRTLTPGYVAALARCGVNRASLGVQSFDPLVQRTVNRVQSFEQTRAAADRLRAAGVEKLSLDLMYGLPFQTEESVRDTVGRALELDPDRVSIFGYAHVPWVKRHQALLPEEALPKGAERVRQFEAAAASVLEAGYLRIGLDHFAKPEDSLAAALGAKSLKRNFQGYTDDAAPALVGLGASAISSLPEGYAQNAASAPAYRRAVEAGRLATARGLALTPEDRLRGEVIERLMCDLEVDLAQVCLRHDVDPAFFAPEWERLKALEAEGLARLRRARVTVPDEARDLVRVVSAVFDARLEQSAVRHAGAI